MSDIEKFCCAYCQAQATKQQHEISRLESEVSRLEDVRMQQETSIQHLHDTVGKTSEEHGRKRDQAAHTIHALTSELSTTKRALEDVTKRERQVDSRFVGSFYIYSSLLGYYYYHCWYPSATAFASASDAASYVAHSNSGRDN